MRAKNLLLGLSDLFSKSDGDIERTDLVKHKFNTSETLQIRQRPTRIPFAREKEVEEMIEDMQMVYRRYARERAT